METIKAPPSDWRGTLRHLGPGLIISATIVGSGELIVTPKLGATAGFTLLWFIIVGCVLKVFVQIELGRFAIARHLTTLEALDTMPGPRLVVSWLVWVWLADVFRLRSPRIASGFAGLHTRLLAGVERPPLSCHKAKNHLKTPHVLLNGREASPLAGALRAWQSDSKRSFAYGSG